MLRSYSYISTFARSLVIRISDVLAGLVLTNTRLLAEVGNRDLLNGEKWTSIDANSIVKILLQEVYC
jgi:hypothetical protein